MLSFESKACSSESKSCSPESFSFLSKSVSPSPLSPSRLSHVCQETSHEIMKEKVFVSTISNNVQLWHHRLGHLPFNSMKHITTIPKFTGKREMPCSICPMARQSKPFFSNQ